MNGWLIFAALNGALGVAAGAYAAHGATGSLGLEGVERFNVAARYQLIHALALIALVLLAGRQAGWTLPLSISAWGFAAGLVLFCGSLYLLGLTGNGMFARFTPFGGSAFILGWLALAWYGVTGGSK